MSTGADCRFIEVSAGRWVYDIQAWPYGDNDQYSRHGPFRSFRLALRHLDENNANPGGWSVQTHPDHVHEWEMGEVSVPVGVEASVRIESLGPNPSPDAVLALMNDGNLTVQHLRIHPVYGLRQGRQCASCGAEDR